MARWISPWARWSICGVWTGSAAAAYPNTSTNRCGKSENRPATFAGYRQGWTSVFAKDLPDLYVDLSTVGEGYAADHLARLMEQEGIARYLVSVGGALSSRGMNAQGQPWRVAIQKPTDRENAVQAIVDINGHGISTSGSYRNYYELDGKRISHVIDPQTGRPIEHNLVSVTVIAPTALEADGWDTGLMVLGTQKAQEVVRREGLAVFMIMKEGEGFKTGCRRSSKRSGER